MRLAIGPEPLRGTLPIMPSKSASHRALLCAALAKGRSEIAPLQRSQDVLATMDCLQALGLVQSVESEALAEAGYYRYALTGGAAAAPGPLRVLDCRESGSTLRFLLPLALDGGGPVRLTGAARLLERPLAPYRQLCAEQGIRWEQDTSGILVEGRLRPGQFQLPGDVSSQFITGLLYALPRLPGDSTITLTTPLESRGYVEMTLEALGRAGVTARFLEDGTISVPGGQSFAPAKYRVPGDWSHAAFFLVAGATRGGITLDGLDRESSQGDRAIYDILRGMGAALSLEDGGIRAERGSLTGREIDVRDVPDLVPALCVAACAAQGVTRIHGAARLRLKESDRLHAMALELSKLGAAIEEAPDSLTIHGGRPLRHATVQSHNDHRVAMALAVAAAQCEGGLTLAGAEAVEKSAPRFFDEYTSLGGVCRAGHVEP